MLATDKLDKHFIHEKIGSRPFHDCMNETDNDASVQCSATPNKVSCVDGETEVRFVSSLLKCTIERTFNVSRMFVNGASLQSDKPSRTCIPDWQID